MATSKSWVQGLPCAVALSIAALTQPAWGAPTAHFELRLAPHETDAILTLGDPNDDTLDLEVWVEVSDATAPVWAVSLFLKASQDGVILFDENYDGVPFVSFSCPFNGVNNTPFTGDFSPACFEPGGTMAGVGVAALYGTFSVSAIAEGSVSYIFDGSDTDVRLWKITLADFTDIAGSALSFSIDPAVAAIQVVATAPSADADGDGDVDLSDYRALQACATVGGADIAEECITLDLNLDGAIDDGDVWFFLRDLTGVNPIPGDLTGDRDIDLKDFGRFQLCLLNWTDPQLAGMCGRADVDRDGDIDLEDYAAMSSALVGPTR